MKVKGQWCYLYRAIDEHVGLVDARLSEQRDMAAAKAFFEQAKQTVEQVPEGVVSDGHTSYPRALAGVWGPEGVHHRVDCRANPIEQDHRGVKQRYYPTLGFKSVEAAARFCQVVDEIRQCFRSQAVVG